MPQAPGAARHAIRQDRLEPVGNALAEFSAAHREQHLGQRRQIVLGLQAAVFAQRRGPRREGLHVETRVARMGAGCGH